MSQLEPGYTADSLLRGIEHSKKNIAVLEKAIVDERKQIADMRYMIQSLEKAATQKADIEADIRSRLTVVRDGSPA